MFRRRKSSSVHVDGNPCGIWNTIIDTIAPYFDSTYLPTCITIYDDDKKILPRSKIDERIGTLRDQLKNHDHDLLDLQDDADEFKLTATHKKLSATANNIRVSVNTVADNKRDVHAKHKLDHITTRVEKLEKDIVNLRNRIRKKIDNKSIKNKKNGSP